MGGRAIHDDDPYIFCQTHQDCKSQPCPELPASCLKYGGSGVNEGNKKHLVCYTVATTFVQGLPVYLCQGTEFGAFAIIPQLVPRSNANLDSCRTDSDCTHGHCPVGSASCLGYGAPSVSDNGQKCVASAFVETRTLTMIQDVPVYELVTRKGDVNMENSQQNSGRIRCNVKGMRECRVDEAIWHIVKRKLCQDVSLHLPNHVTA